MRFNSGPQPPTKSQFLNLTIPSLLSICFWSPPLEPKETSILIFNNQEFLISHDFTICDPFHLLMVAHSTEQHQPPQWPPGVVVSAWPPFGSELLGCKEPYHKGANERTSNRLSTNNHVEGGQRNCWKMFKPKIESCWYLIIYASGVSTLLSQCATSFSNVFKS